MYNNHKYRLSYNLSQTFDKRGEARDIYHFKLETFDLNILDYLEEHSFMITTKNIPEVDDFQIFYKLEPGDMESWDALDILGEIYDASIADNSSEALESFVYDKLKYYEYGIHYLCDEITPILGVDDQTGVEEESNMEDVD